MESHRITKELNACAILCDACYSGCLQEVDVKAMSNCIKLNRDCAEICRITASFISRDSENIDNFLMLCNEICNTCADECEKHDHDHCKKCAEACNTCAEACHAHHQQITQA